MHSMATFVYSVTYSNGAPRDIFSPEAGPGVGETGSAVGTTGSVVGATGPGVDPTGPGVDPTGPGVIATGVGVDATGPGVGATRPGADVGAGVGALERKPKQVGSWVCLPNVYI